MNYFTSLAGMILILYSKHRSELAFSDLYQLFYCACTLALLVGYQHGPAFEMSNLKGINKTL